MKIRIGTIGVVVAVTVLAFVHGCNRQMWRAGGMMATGGRKILNFNDDWRFAKGDHAGAEAVGFDDSAWEAVRLPHDWAISGPFDPKENGYAGKLPWRGQGWYRKVFKLSEKDAGKRIYFDFDGVMAFPKVYVNGQLAGQWDYGYMSFRVDATKFVKFGEDNVIAVSVDTRKHGTRWYPGAGIYRKVTMTVTNPVHVAHWGTFVTTTKVDPAVDPNSAIVQVSSEVKNDSDAPAKVTVKIQLLDEVGQVVSSGQAGTEIKAGESKTIKQSLPVVWPRLWDVNDPQLYTAKTLIRSGDKIVDGELTRFGIRTFEFTANDGFHLNGRRLQLHGVDLHHDQGPLGAAFYRRAGQRQLQIMKDMGCNALRTSHNPPSPEMIELCDELGIIVWDECFDKWNETSDRIGDIDLVEYNKRQLRNFVMRDRNSPSVMTWSLGNEMADIESNRSGKAVEQVKELADFVRGLDPTRPVGMGCFVPSAVGTGVLGSLDLTGWNYARRYAAFRQKYPDKPIVYSESASALSTRGFYKLPFATSKTDYADKQKQVDSYDLNAAAWSDIPDKEFKLMADDKFVAGELVWTGFDYLGEPTPFSQEARSSYFGIVDLCGMPKDRFYLYRSYWRDDDVTVHILPHWNWSDRVGKNVPVFVYTNGDSAELFLNGKSLGKRTKGQRPEKPINYVRGAKITASSEETDKGNTAAKACDGDDNSRWCAADDSSSQWLEVDLGAVKSVGYLAITFEKEAKNYGYDVKASKDGQDWQTIATKRTQPQQRRGPREAFHDVSTEARYLKIEFKNLLSGTWASVSELGAYSRRVESDYYDVTYDYRLRWNDVIYQPGTLEAVAYKDGVEIGRAVMKTAGAPAQLRLTADRTKLEASGEDLSYVTVEALDKDGTLCPLADNMVKFEIEGPADIAGVGNGNPLSLEPFTADYRKLFYGKAMVIVRTKEGMDGKIRLTATSEGLQPDEVTMVAR